MPQPAAATTEAAAPGKNGKNGRDGAHEAGVQDATAALAGKAADTATGRAGDTATGRAGDAAAGKAGDAAGDRAGDIAAEKAGDGAAKGVERDHHEVDAARFNTEGTTSSYATREAATEDKPVEQVVPVPDVMILPEPQRNRPTVVLDRAAVPGQPASDRPRPVRTPQDRDRATRVLQDRVRTERTSALLETSPFWLGEDDQRAAAGPARQTAVPVARPPRKKGREPRRPLSGLVALLALALVATFFSWVSAEPFWLAVGHGQQGDATVSRCTGSGFTQRCVGEFVAANGEYTVQHVALLGVDPEQPTARARMVSSDSRQVYVGDTGVLVHLRWSLGFLLVLLCGLGIAGLTGVRRLETPRARRSALLLSVAGPVALLIGFLAAAY